MVGWGIGAAGVIIAVVTAAFSIVHFVEMKGVAAASALAFLEIDIFTPSH